MPPKSSRGSSAAPVNLNNQDLQIKFVSTNPKKRGAASFDRYDKYKAARTVGDALKAGATLGDLKNDHTKGYLQVETASASSSSASSSLSRSLNVRAGDPRDTTSQPSVPQQQQRVQSQLLKSQSELASGGNDLLGVARPAREGSLLHRLQMRGSPTKSVIVDDDFSFLPPIEPSQPSKPGKRLRVIDTLYLADGSS